MSHSKRLVFFYSKLSIEPNVKGKLVLMFDNQRYWFDKLADAMQPIQNVFIQCE